MEIHDVLAIVVTAITAIEAIVVTMLTRQNRVLRGHGDRMSNIENRTQEIADKLAEPKEKAGEGES